MYYAQDDLICSVIVGKLQYEYGSGVYSNVIKLTSRMHCKFKFSVSRVILLCVDLIKQRPKQRENSRTILSAITSFKHLQLCANRRSKSLGFPSIYQTYLNIIEYISPDYQQVLKVLPGKLKNSRRETEASSKGRTITGPQLRWKIVLRAKRLIIEYFIRFFTLCVLIKFNYRIGWRCKYQLSIILRPYCIRVSFLAWKLQLHRYSLLTMDKNWFMKRMRRPRVLGKNFQK